MRIEVYVDNETTPFATIRPPEKFKLNTSQLSDGQHILRFRAIDKDDEVSERVVSFLVQNGPEIAVHGISTGDIVVGEIDILANAYSSRIGDEFEPMRIETPAPIPTWTWVLVLVVLGWGAGYISQELHNRVDVPYADTALDNSPTLLNDNVDVSAPVSAATKWSVSGERVYGNNCSSCHQSSGLGLAGVFPPLKDNPAVLADDPKDHINAVVHGLSGKIIDGVSYASPMPPFGSLLNDADIAAVVNHERTQWGNNSSLVTESDVTTIRQEK